MSENAGMTDSRCENVNKTLRGFQDRIDALISKTKDKHGEEMSQIQDEIEGLKSSHTTKESQLEELKNEFKTLTEVCFRSALSRSRKSCTTQLFTFVLFVLLII